ncbi:hypothetical protein SAMN04488491_2651 [Psychrobacter sp. LV10R520-6]|nr:hypothetical protein SAMN04488491_2651 [Psychrobacter sp. LV10R520-6]
MDKNVLLILHSALSYHTDMRLLRLLNVANVGNVTHAACR